MWMPKTEAEIVDAVTSGALSESSIFEAKSEIDKDNKETARDIAAMTTNGGVIVYGIAEDAQKRLTILNPILLKNTPERISNIISTSISERPEVFITTIPTANDPSVGYLVVVIPQSPRAPHMMIAGGDNRYYSRNATGKYRLVEADVSRIYAQRAEWDRNREKLLDQFIAENPPSGQQGFFYLGAWPVVRREEMLEAVFSTNVQTELQYLLHVASNDLIFSGTRFAGDFMSFDMCKREATGLKWWYPHRPEEPSLRTEIRFGDDGTVKLLSARAILEHEDNRLIFEQLLASLSKRFVYVLGQLYSKCAYIGPVDIGVAILNIQGATSRATYQQIRHPLHDASFRFDAPEYRKLLRVSSMQFSEPHNTLAEELLSKFFHATTQGAVDPFKPTR
jgi:hypothetical protein